MYEYKAICTKVYDGDTITVHIDLGLEQWSHNQKIRLLGIDTPELRGPERPEGLKVRDWLKEQILDKEITVKTYKSRDKGKYGRWLMEVFIDGRNLNEEMISSGMAKQYGKKQT